MRPPTRNAAAHAKCGRPREMRAPTRCEAAALTVCSLTAYTDDGISYLRYHRVYGARTRAGRGTGGAGAAVAAGVPGDGAAADVGGAPPARRGPDRAAPVGRAVPDR